MGFQVIVTLYMQRALGYRPARAGLGLVPVAAVIAAVSLGLSARLTARFGARPLLLAGLVMITAALALLTQLPAHAGYATRLLPPLVLFGLGAGLTLPAVTVLGMASATDADAGVISGMFNTTQQVGAALGVALLTTLATWRTGGGTSAQALTSGYQLALATGAGLGAASIAVAAVLLRPRRETTGQPGRDAGEEGGSGPASAARRGEPPTARSNQPPGERQPVTSGRRVTNGNRFLLLS
jgi:MFS family permease